MEFTFSDQKPLDKPSSVEFSALSGSALALTKDNQGVRPEVALTYRLGSSGNVISPEALENGIELAISEFSKKETGLEWYRAAQDPDSRQRLEIGLKDEVGEILKPFDIIVDGLQITKVDMSDRFVAEEALADARAEQR